MTAKMTAREKKTRWLLQDITRKNSQGEDFEDELLDLFNLYRVKEIVD